MKTATTKILCQPPLRRDGIIIMCALRRPAGGSCCCSADTRKHNFQQDRGEGKSEGESVVTSVPCLHWLTHFGIDSARAPRARCRRRRRRRMYPYRTRGYAGRPILPVLRFGVRRRWWWYVRRKYCVARALS